MAPGPPAAPSSLISTKLVAPRRIGTEVAREPLLARLLAARRMRCIVLRGGAGSGKTSLLNNWQQALTPLGFEVAWLTLSPDDDEPARFVDYLLASLAKIEPAIVREAAAMSALGADRDAIERTVIALVQSLAAYGRETVLVLDDLQHLKDPLILDAALQFLIDYAPANFHLALATRRAVPLALARLHAEGMLLELDAADLRFTPAESEQFLRARLPSLSAREAAHLHSLADGWPAGLQLLALNLRREAPDGGSARRVPIHDAGSFADYFEREVLARLTAEDVEHLVRLSVCQRFCARLAAVLLAGDDERAAPERATRLIARLESEHLFIVPVDSAERERWYRLHPLLREVLLARLAAMLREDRQALQRRAGDWFEGEGLVDEAVRYRLDAGEAEAAAALVERCADELLLRGDFRALFSTLRRLPAPVVASRLRLRLLESQMLMRTRQLDALARSLDALERDRPAGETQIGYQIVVSRALLDVLRDDSGAAAARLPALRSLPADADGWAIGTQKNLLTLVLLHQGEFDAARQAQEEGPPRLVRGEPLLGGPSGELAGRCLAGLARELQGQVQQAERIYRAVLRECDHVRDRNDPALLATALLGEALYERGEVAAAVALLEPQIDLIERAVLPDGVVRSLLVLARAHRLGGRRLECMAYLERLEDRGLALGQDRLLAAALYEQMSERLRSLEFAEADALLARLNEIEARNFGCRGTRAEAALAASQARARHALAHGQPEAAFGHIRPLLAALRERGALRRVVRTQMFAAVVERLCGRADAALAAAHEAVALGHRLGLVRSLLDAHPDATALLSALRGAPGLDPVQSFYLDRLLAVADLAPDPPAAPQARAARMAAAARARAPTEPLSQRETDVLRMLALALPNKKIARSLGLTADTVKWHLRNVYRKLDVAGRDDAVARARDLGLDIGPR